MLRHNILKALQNLHHNNFSTVAFFFLRRGEVLEEWEEQEVKYSLENPTYKVLRKERGYKK